MLNETQQQILMMVEDYRYGSRISRAIDITNGCAYKYLKMLETMGILMKDPIQKDSREIQICLTEKGKIIREHLRMINTILSAR